MLTPLPLRVNYLFAAFGLFIILDLTLLRIRVLDAEGRISPAEARQLMPVLTFRLAYCVLFGIGSLITGIIGMRFPAIIGAVFLFFIGSSWMFCGKMNRLLRMPKD